MRTEPAPTPTPISVVVNFCEADHHLLSRCVSSMLWQLQSQDELILVCDGDHRCESQLIAELMCSQHGSAGKNITALSRLADIAAEARGGDPIKPQGISTARNNGWEPAKNEWIKFLDVDDLLAPFALNAIRKILADTSPGKQVLVGGQGTIVNGKWVSDFHRIEGCLRTRQVNGVLFGDGLDQIKRSNPFLVSHSVIRRTALEKVGGFDERIHFEEDWDLWLKIHRDYGDDAFGFMPERICYYTIDDKLRAAKKRDHTVEGMDVREYFRKTYGCNPS